MARQYITVRLPKELLEEVDNIIEKGIRGYKTRAEFVKEAIREKLERNDERERRR